MAQDNVEVVREWIEAFNRGGLEEIIGVLDPEIEWTTTSVYLEAGTYQGHEGVGRYLRRAMARWEDVWIEPTRLIGAGEQVVASVRVTARDRQTGSPTALTLTVVAELHGGVIVRLCNYTNQAEAFEAAGLTR